MDQQDCFPSDGSRRKSISLSVPASRGCLHSLAHGPELLCFCHHISIYNSDSPAAFLLLRPWYYTGPTWITQDYFIVLHLIIPTKSLLLHKATFIGSRDWNRNTFRESPFSLSQGLSEQFSFLNLVKTFSLLNPNVLILLLYHG